MKERKLLGIMAEQNISQRELARLIGVSKNTINQKLNGKGAFDTGDATNICNVLHIDDMKTRAEIFLS